MSFLVVSVASLAILVVVHGMTFLIGRRLGRYNVVDVTWGVGFVAVAAVCAAVGTGDLFRRLLLLVLVAVWGLRLAWHMVGKSAGRGEDPRYRALLRDDFSAKNVIRRIFLVQGAAGWFISLPLQVSAVLGRAHMEVGDLLKLGPGTVLELDRKVGEAIDIYVNNRLVARGEVVLVEDKLGVTMTEIIKADRS